MSLHALATNMASKGRNGDSMLVHMTPGEVHGLQALAMKHGGSLTINPDTGLPEANFLKRLLPMIAGFALAPLTAGTSLAFLGATPLASAMTVGGITGLATGSLQKGLMAGLGAYGGAGLQASLVGAGAGTAASNAAALGVEGAATGAGSQAAMLAEQNAGFGAEGLTRLADSAKVAAGATPTTTGMLSTGFDEASKNPMAFAKQNIMPLAAAASPIVADMMVPTTTKAPSPMNPGRIREKRWNGQYFEDVASTDAGVYNESGRNFSDLYRGYNKGGIVALAEGGMPHFDAGGYTQDQINAALKTELAARGGTSQADLTSYAKSKYGLTDAQINAAYDTLPGFNAQGQWDKNDYLATHVPGQVDSQMVVNAARAADRAALGPGSTTVDPSGVTRQLTPYMPDFNKDDPYTLAMLGSKIGTGDTQAGIFFDQNPNYVQKAKDAWAVELERLNAIDRAAGRLPALGADTKAPTGLANLNAGAGSVMPNADTKAPTGLAQIDTITKLANNAAAVAPPANETPAARDARLFQQAGGDWNKAAALRTAEDQALVADPNYWTNKAGLAALDPGASDTTKWFAARGLGFDPIDQVIDNFLVKYKPQLAAMLPKEQEAAMRAALDKEKLNEADVIKATGLTIAQLAAAKRADGSIIVPGNLDEVPVGSLPGGVSGAGKTVINENGTITTRPDTSLPMKDVRNAYTEGGGSLGYTSPSFDKIEDFNAKYVDRMTGDSRAAYDYLTGKAGATYPTKSTVGQIARPYDEAVLGYPARGNLPFTYDKDTGKMVRNMDYVAPGRDEKGNVTYGMSLNDVKKYLTDTPLSGQSLYDWAQTNKISAQQIADATGRSLSSVYADFRGGAKAKSDKAADVAKGGDSIQVIDSSGYNTETITAVKQADGTYLGGNGKKYDASGKLLSAGGGMMGYAMGGLGNLGGYSDGGRLLRGPGDGVSDSIPATIGRKQQPARLADGEFVIPARIVSELGNGSTDAGAKKLYAMMDRVQRARGKTTGKNKVAANSRADKYLPA